MSVCFICNEPTHLEDSARVYVEIKPVTMFDQYGEMDYRFLHYDCMSNNDKPEFLKVCDTCGLTGKDARGSYPDLYDQPFIQHPECVDWESKRKGY